MSRPDTPYAQRLAEALERAHVTRRGLARLLAEREGGAVETKRRNVYKWLEDGTEPEPLRAGLLAVLLNAPELAVTTQRQSAAAQIDAHLEELGENDAELLANQAKVIDVLREIRDGIATLLEASDSVPKRRSRQ